MTQEIFKNQPDSFGAADQDQEVDDLLHEVDTEDGEPEPEPRKAKVHLPPSGPHIQLFRFEALDQCAKELQLQKIDREASEELKLLAKHMEEAGQYRELANPDQRQIAQLEAIFPNFAEVFDYLHSAAALAELSRRQMDSAPDYLPMLFVGPPGVGKSYFARELSKALGTECQTLQMNTAQSNSQLSGSSSFWSNHQPGSVFKSLFFGRYGNPLIILEEVDKMMTDGRYDPASSLYQLLEKETATRFSDLCYPWFNLDASRVNYICTANEIDTVPAALQSRLKVFHIPAPDQDQARRVIANIFGTLLKSLSPALGQMQMSEEVMDGLSGLSPRVARNLLQEGIGRAVKQKSLERLTTAHVRLPKAQPQAQERRIGFLG